MSSEAVDDGGTPDHVDTVAEMVAALRTDPVLVEPTMGNGFTAEVTAHLEGLVQQAADAGIDVFVVATTTPVGLDPSLADEQITTLLDDALDVPGVYVVHTTLGSGHISAVGDLGTDSTNVDTELSLLRYDAADQIDAAVEQRWGEDARSADVVDVAAAVEATVRVAEDGAFPERTYEEPGVSNDVAVLTSAQAREYTEATWVYATPDYDREESWQPASAGLQAVVATMALLLTALLVYRGLRAARAFRLARRDRDPGRLVAEGRRTSSPADLEQQAEGWRRRATARLGRIESEVRPAAVARLPAERVDLLRGSVEEAHRLLEPGPEDPPATGEQGRLAALGAWVLAETAWAAARGRGDGEWRCCFLHPGHGTATSEESLSGGLRVPVCSRCSRDLRARRPADVLTTTHRRWGRTSVRPYYDDDTVWARTGFGSLGDELWRELGRERAARRVAR